MISLRSQIRHAVAERLQTLLPGRVFDTPVSPFEREQLPLGMLTVEQDQPLDEWIMQLFFCKFFDSFLLLKS